MIRIIPVILPLLLLAATGCEKNKWAIYEQKMIDAYIKSLKDTTYVLYPSGLYYIELIPGTGPNPRDNDTVYFKYKAAFTDYVQFDQNDPYTTPLKYVIGSFVGMKMKGVDEGLRYMKAGGTSRLLTPSDLAYGFEGLWGIVPGFTPVLWTIELDSIKPYQGRK
jgi:FKBP-type peptidyl-prolyl cis-trans isomerase